MGIGVEKNRDGFIKDTYIETKSNRLNKYKELFIIMKTFYKELFIIMNISKT